MARGRMLDRAYTKSRKINALQRDHRLAYAMILPYLDREGRINAEPIFLKANVFRWSDYTLDEIQAAVHAIAGANLARLYADEDNAAILQYADFHKFNSPNRKEAASEYPSPDQDTVRPVPLQGTSNARAMPVENVNVNVNDNVNENTLVNRESTPSEALAATPPRENHQAFLEAWNQNRGSLPAVTTLNAKRKSMIGSLVKEHGANDAVTLLADATRAVAADDYWVQKQYGFDNLLRPGRVLEKAEKWRAGGVQMGEANLKLATQVAGWARALEEVN